MLATGTYLDLANNQFHRVSTNPHFPEDVDQLNQVFGSWLLDFKGDVNWAISEFPFVISFYLKLRQYKNIHVTKSNNRYSLMVVASWTFRNKSEVKKSFLAMQETVQIILTSVITEQSSVFPLLEKIYESNMGLFEDINLKLKTHFDAFSESDKDLLPKNAPLVELRLLLIYFSNLLIKKSPFEAMVLTFLHFSYYSKDVYNKFWRKVYPYVANADPVYKYLPALKKTFEELVSKHNINYLLYVVLQGIRV